MHHRHLGCRARRLHGRSYSSDAAAPGRRPEHRHAAALGQPRRRAADPELVASLEFDEAIPWLPPSEIEAAHPLVKAVEAASAEVLGEAPPLMVFPGGTDAPWYAAKGIPTIPSFGPGMLTSAHGPNEFVSVRSILEAARIYARVILTYCR